MARHVARSSPAVHPVGPAALQRQSAGDARRGAAAAADDGEGGLGWPGPAPDGTGVGWPADPGTDVPAQDPVDRLGVVPVPPVDRRPVWRRLSGRSAPAATETVPSSNAA